MAHIACAHIEATKEPTTGVTVKRRLSDWPEIGPVLLLPGLFPGGTKLQRGVIVDSFLLYPYAGFDAVAMRIARAKTAATSAGTSKAGGGTANLRHRSGSCDFAPLEIAKLTLDP
jgi:hypothetical protein